MVQAFNAKVHFSIYAIFTFKVLMRALGCSSWSLYHTLAVRSLEVEKTKSSVTKSLQQLKNFGFELYFEYQEFYQAYQVFKPLSSPSYSTATPTCVFSQCAPCR